MNKHLCRFILQAIAILIVAPVCAQSEWPKSITTSDGTVINIYQPQAEYFAGNMLKSRSAFSVRDKEATDPVFGTYWSTETVETDRDTREVVVESAQINHIKIPADSSLVAKDNLVSVLQSYIPKVSGVLPLDEVMLSLDEQQNEKAMADKINNALPKLIFRTRPSMLVSINGSPILKENKKWGVEMVVNSPFVIVKFKDGKYYLHGGGHWYVAPDVSGPYSFTNDKVKHKLKRIAKSLEKSAQKNNDLPTDETRDNIVYDIVVSTSPAELIQSDGSPDLVPVSGTSLLYVKNSDNDIFVDTQNQLYYVLLSGRWYSSHALNENSSWQYIPSNQLPADFAKIPEGSPKDGVLANVAGTDAAREAVLDAQVAQTAKIDRRSASTNVVYDGSPIFKPIAGTDMQYAVNTSSTVLEEQGHYYAVDNGIWFIADSPDGPWVVSTTRPQQIDRIPPDCPVFNAKYVSIYDSTPDYVYDGYTSGYLNSYVDGSTVVYGTGYDYDPWIGMYYYPRPWTWGFDMCYNPWSGWGFGSCYDCDWFDDGFGWDAGFGFGWGGWYGGGWWGGATTYRPAYRNWHGGRFRSDLRGGFYGRNITINPGTHMHMRFNNNVYRGRQGVMRPERHFAGPGTGNGFNRETMFTDRQGNIYRNNAQGQWQQRVNRNWSAPARQMNPAVLQRQRQMYSRGQVRTMNFQRASNYGGMRFGGGSFGGSHISSGGGTHFSGGGRSFGHH
ncbi:MAG: hypothetical protein JST96_09480 [Bacteroidetes bacterium]|nr:hypothetical protein [Bacteroidota bacterium]